MSDDDIQTACVIRYPDLWAREAHRGETEGRKDRPVAVGVRVSRADGDLLLLFPIATKEPEATRFAREIPPAAAPMTGRKHADDQSRVGQELTAGGQSSWRTRVPPNDPARRPSFETHMARPIWRDPHGETQVDFVTDHAPVSPPTGRCHGGSSTPGHNLVLGLRLEVAGIVAFVELT